MSWNGRCNKHVSEQRGFCALEPGHKDPCSVTPRVERQGVNVPVKRKLVPAHYIKVQQYKNATVKCLGDTVGSRNGCGATLRVADLVYIQKHWYTEPFGCSGGDYWNVGEGQFFCPECSTQNRLYERPEVVKLKSYFKSVEDRHDR
jgi:hypothetical protein